MISEIIKIEEGYAVKISAKTLGRLNLREGDKVEISESADNIILTKVNSYEMDEEMDEEFKEAYDELLNSFSNTLKELSK